MNCFSPVTIENPNFNIDSSYEQHQYKKILVPCGRCPACVVGTANQWRIRLKEELEVCTSAFFVTFTYDDSHLPLQNMSGVTGYPIVAPYVSKRDVQTFFKRLRKRLGNVKIKYFLVSEYGPRTFRPHYHAIIFNLPYSSTDSVLSCAKCRKVLEEVWANGGVKVDQVTDGRISYVTKYVCSITDLPPYLVKPFRLMSRRPAIGFSYFSKVGLMEYHRSHLANYYLDNGRKLALPRYYKDKIFDDAMKLELSERSALSRGIRQFNERVSAKELGYKDWYDYKVQSIQSFERKFDLKMKKNRKDL